MQTVITTNNTFDTILLVNDQDKVIRAWIANRGVIDHYLRYGANANEWNATYSIGTQIAEYGAEVGRNGRIDDAARREFWGATR